MSEEIYLDHAATSFPKPPEVTSEIARFLRESAGSPGRSGHRLSGAAARLVFTTREAVSRMLGVRDSRRVIFTRGATEGLNLALFGLLEPGDHVVTTSMEHNAVMRPLKHLSDTRGIEVSVVSASPQGLVDPDDVRKALRPRTRLTVVNHASNVCGAVQPLTEIAGRLEGRTLLVVDAAQTAGVLPLDVGRLSVDVLAASAHKGLLGPAGIGVLYLREGVDPQPLIHGGTGSNSESDEQPGFLPDRYEAGTPNTVGVAGLGGALKYREGAGVKELLERERWLGVRVLNGLQELPHVELHGPRSMEDRLPVFSFRVRGMDPGEVGRLLEREHGIMVRAGLHCSPQAHRTLGTFPRGTVRASLGLSSTEEDVDRLLDALSRMSHA